jgi:hypothetical protein
MNGMMHTYMSAMQERNVKDTMAGMLQLSGGQAATFNSLGENGITKTYNPETGMLTITRDAKLSDLGRYDV